MFDEIDEVLRKLLIREIPIANSEIDIAFDQPKREWSARLSRPTLNLFLHDVRENVKLRQQGQGPELERAIQAGTVTQKHKAHRVDLHYALTVWAKEPEDEHRLLAATLLALFRHATLVEDLPESLQDQPAPIALKVAQYDELEKPSDLWNVMDNQQRPVINLVVTLALHPFKPLVGPIVRSRELVIGQALEPAATGRLKAEAGARRTWTVGGQVRSHAERGPLDHLRVVLLPAGQEATLQADGRFVLSCLDAGDYTLEISAAGRAPVRHLITVPAPDYDFVI
jgi:hypothetical protein